MKTTLLLPLALLGGILLSGCGGSGGSSSSTAAPAGKSSLQLTLVWPVKTNTRLIPVDSKSITAVLTDANGKSLGTQTIARPTTGNSSVVNFNNLTAGAVTLTASAYPNADGTGVAQATGTESTTLVTGQTGKVTVTMADTIVSLTILVNGQAISESNTNLAVGKTAQLSVTPLNAQGQVVLISPSTLTYTSAAPTFFSVTSAGLVSSLKTGTPTTITAKETESGVSNAVTFNVGSTVGTGNQPVAMFGDLQHQFIYAWGNSGIMQFSKDTESGKLTALNPPIAPAPAKLQFQGASVFSGPSFVYGICATSTANSTLVGYKFTANGQLVQAPGTESLSNSVGYVSGDKDGNFLFVSTSEFIIQYKINANGSLTQNGAFTLPSKSGGSDHPIGPMIEIGRTNMFVIAGQDTNGAVTTPEIVTVSCDPTTGKLTTVAQQSFSTTVAATQFIESPLSNSNMFYAEGLQNEAGDTIYVTELFKMNDDGTLIDEGLASTLPSLHVPLSLAGVTGNGQQIVSVTPGSNKVQAYFVNNDGSLNQLAHQGTLPTNMGYNAPGPLGMYIDGNDSANFVYVPGFSANVISQFVQENGNLGLTPLTPATVPD